MKRTIAILLGSMALVACAGSDSTTEPVDDAAAADEEADTTSAPTSTDAPETTEAPETTQPPTTVQPTTTPAPETTEPPAADRNTGVVWESAVDPARVNTDTEQPAVEGNGVALRLQLVVDIDPAVSGELGDACADELENLDIPAERCLLAQFAFNVAEDADLLSDEAFLTVDAIINPDGRQIDVFQFADAFPGTIDNLMNGMIPGGEPGATVKVSIEFDTYDFVIPPADQFLPIDFG